MINICLFIIIFYVLQFFLFYNPKIKLDDYNKIKDTNEYIEVNIHKGIFVYNGWLNFNFCNDPTVIFFCGRGRTASDVLYEMRNNDNEKYYTKNFNYNLLLINYPGCGQSKGFSNESQVKIMNNEIHNYITTNSQFKNKEVIVIGHSLGNGPAILYAKKYNPQKLILVSPYYSGIKEYQKYLHVKLPNILISNQYKNNINIKQVKSQTLILASKSDKVVDFNSSYNLYDSISSNKNVRFYKFDNIIHKEMIVQKEPVKQIYEFLSER